MGTEQVFVEKVRNAGIIGAGGAGFPTYVKIQRQVETVIANAVECEPLLYTDKVLLGLFTSEIISAIKLVIEHCHATRGYVAIKSKYSDLIETVQKAIDSSDSDNITVFPVDDFYPAGDENVLVTEITGKVIPTFGIPLDCGVLVQNVGTLFNIHHAVKDQPVIDKVVTVTGDVHSPSVLQVPLGISFKSLVDLCGGCTTDDPVFIDGGPMMGHAADPEDVVKKTTSAVLCLDKYHPVSISLLRTARQSGRISPSTCMNCGNCTKLCPRHYQGYDIHPHKLMAARLAGLKEEEEQLIQGLRCCECGLCEHFACDFNLSPKKLFQQYKQSAKNDSFKIKPEWKTSVNPLKDRSLSKVPSSRLIKKLNLTKYLSTPRISLSREVKPHTIRIPLNQHIGCPARPVVKTGESVNRGSLIALPEENTLGIPYHASVDGTVMSADNEILITPE